MLKTLFILVLGVLSLLLVTVAVSHPFSKSPTSVDLSWPPRPDYSHLNEKPRLSAADSQSADDFYQRHPEMSASAGIAIDTTDYFLRHPELRPAAPSTDVSDYFLRH